MHALQTKHASVFLQGFSSGWSRWAVSLSIMSLLFYLIVGIEIRSMSVPSTCCGWIEGGCSADQVEGKVEVTRRCL